MATSSGPKQNDDSERDKPGKKETPSAEAPTADRSIRPPERFHLFPGKKPSTASSKSDGDRMKRSTFGTQEPVGPVPPAVQVGIVVSVKRPNSTVKQELISFKGHIASRKKALCEAAMNLEDLEWIFQTLRDTQESIAKTRELFERHKARLRTASAWESFWL